MKSEKTFTLPADFEERDIRTIIAGLETVREYWADEWEAAPEWAKCCYCEQIERIEKLKAHFDNMPA